MEKHTEDFKREAVRIALSRGLPRRAPACLRYVRPAVAVRPPGFSAVNLGRDHARTNCPMIAPGNKDWGAGFWTHRPGPSHCA